MTYENCKRLLAHYKKAKEPGFQIGSPPKPLDNKTREKMDKAYKEMNVKIKKNYAKQHRHEEKCKKEKKDKNTKEKK